MRILYLAHRIPYPPDKGDKIRSFHQVDFLSKRHEVWCAFFVDDPADMKHVATMEKCCQRVVAIPLPKWRGAARGLRRLMTGGSLSVGYCDDARMRTTLRKWRQIVNFDAAVVFSSGMGVFRDEIEANRKVLDLCDWDSMKWAERAKRSRAPRSWLYSVEAKRLAKFETECVRSFDACTVVTQAEADAIDDPELRARVHVIENGVAPSREIPQTARNGEARVGFVGQMDYWPNVEAVRWFADRVWPSVRRQVPNATLEIVGRSPTREILSLESAAVGGITVTGEVADVQPRLSGFDVSVAPLQVGRGVQNKVLEAMAASKPVVLTSAAAEGIDAEDGKHFLVADDAEATADRVVKLLRNPAQRSQLGGAARRRVIERYSWDREMGKLERLLGA